MSIAHTAPACRRCRIFGECADADTINRAVYSPLGYASVRIVPVSRAIRKLGRSTFKWREGYPSREGLLVRVRWFVPRAVFSTTSFLLHCGTYQRVCVTANYVDTFTEQSGVLDGLA
jgi:hypothetical protein